MGVGLEGCSKCIKYMLFFLNFLFWLTGGVILGVALWLKNDPKTSSLLVLTLDGAPETSTFDFSVNILIAVGSVMMVVGFLGCYGAIQESQCLLGTFFTCLVILFACEVAAGIWGYMHKDTVSNEIINFYDNAYDQAIVTTNQQQKASAVLKVYHETLSCCGKGDWTSVLTRLADQTGLTDLCPSGVSTNCHARIRELFSDKIYLIGIAALVVAVIMIFEMIFSMVLCCAIRNSPVY